MAFSNRLRQAREQLGLTQGELAKRLGCTKSAIGNYENGVSSPKEEILLKLFDVLEVDPNFLFQDSFSLSDVSLSFEETNLIKKYRALDERGKSAVLATLNNEYNSIIGEKSDLLSSGA